MQRYLDTGIKDVIAEFPEVGTILQDYDVACVGCYVGTCALRDVVSIHSLPPETEQELMERLAVVLASEQERELPQPTQATSPSPTPTASRKDAPPRELKYSPPLKALVDEHVLIKRWVEVIPSVLAGTDVNRAEDRRLLLDGVDFIRSYADRFHHAKEEDILFKYFDETQAIIQAMLADHETARDHVRQVVEAVDRRDADLVNEHLRAYGELLNGHIEREDEILYPWMDRELTTTQVGELFSKFAAVDRAAGPDFTPNYTRFVERVEALVTP
jgi:hemerythrin-like domain-containing protein